jgi:translation initiation factor 3 subunit M
LRGYFKGLGAEIAAERSDKGIEDDLHKIIGVCDAAFKDNANVTQIEEVLNGIVSMLALVRTESKQIILQVNFSGFCHNGPESISINILQCVSQI